MLKLIFTFRLCMEDPQPIIEPDICIPCFALTLKFLRIFGHLIVKLHVDYNLGFFRYKHSIQKPNKTIEHYLAEYCSESLIHLSLQNCEIDYILHDTQKPFNSIETLHIDRCMFSSDLPFNRLFPKLHTLKLGRNAYEDTSAIKVHFPTIRNLYFLDDIFYLHKKYFQEEDIASLFKLNSHLESSILHLRHEYSSNFIQRIKEYCPNLQIIDKSQLYWRYPEHYLNSGKFSQFSITIIHSNEFFPNGISDKYKKTLINLYYHYRFILPNELYPNHRNF